MSSISRKKSKFSKHTKRNTRELRNIHTKAQIRAVSPSQFSRVAYEEQSPSYATKKSLVLRIFTAGNAYPDLVPRGEVPEASIVDMLKWTRCSSRVQVEGYAIDSRHAAIPDHEGFSATMHVVDDCVLVAVTHEEHGVFFTFGIAPETSGGSQNLWTKFGGEGEQPLGPWCLEVLNPVVFEEVFAGSKGGSVWLMEFERAFAWMWIVFTRACKGLTIITDPVTGERRLEDKR